RCLCPADSTGKNANKKFVQARLPFKRLNPEPKGNQPAKRPCAHACPKLEVSDLDSETSPFSVRSGPPLINGRGPLDNFLSCRRPAPSNKSNIIDLTDDNTSSPVKSAVAATPASPCLATKDKHPHKDKRAKSSSVDHTPETSSVDSLGCDVIDDGGEKVDENESTESVSELSTTQDSASEPEEQNKPKNSSSLGNMSMLSDSSPCSTSNNSPKECKNDEPALLSTPALKTDFLMLNLKEQERIQLQQEKERQKEEAKAVKEKKKEEARKLKEEREKEKREKKEKDEIEKREKKEKEEKEKAERLKAKEELRKSKIDNHFTYYIFCLQRLKAEKAEITRFLKKPKTQQAPKKLAAACGKFAPFEIKENMSLAPLTRVQCEESVLEELDQFLLEPDDNLNGLKEWIGKKPRRSGPTKPRQTDDCMAVEGPKADGIPDRERHGPMKLLQFHENHRPAYWGTCSKKSVHISPRCPFRQDKDLLDYEVDSDDEWEEEEPGESLSHSEGEDEEEGGEDDDDDDGFFVPHGYLSEDEGALEEEEGGDLEKQKLRQTLKAREWDELMSNKKKMKVLEPVVKGCIWEGDGSSLEQFQSYAICLVEPLPKTDTSPSPEELSEKNQKETQLLGQLLPLLHGNVNSGKVIISEFQEFCRQQSCSSPPPSDLSSPQSSAENIPTRILIRRLIKDNAVYEKRSAYRRCCWYVNAEVLSRFGLEALPVPCQWNYLLTGAREEEAQAATGSQGNSPTTPQTSSTTPSATSKRKSTGCMSIRKFMKRCSDTEEAEGFQADTEEDDEDDCIIISTEIDLMLDTAGSRLAVELLKKTGRK
uniref:Chromatin assembly factor 1, subunit A (p150) n=1 Tax=Salarias fasciatus TaxID=181472 RepID=A0A672ICI3_SALFA